MYERILVPVDGSEPAAFGLNEAIKLAKNQGGNIRLVHIVNEWIVVSPETASVNLGQVIDILRNAGASLLDGAKSVARSAGVEVDTVLVEAMGGQAGDHIVQQAKEWRADLIVCGTHGRRGIRRLVMGSDAEYIVRHTPVPVLLVRSREPASK
jgi:nucleotide-binding universal stress UspA family protein